MVNKYNLTTDLEDTTIRAQHLSDSLMVMSYHSAKKDVGIRRMKMLINDIAKAMYKDDNGNIQVNMDMISTDNLEFMREVISETIKDERDVKDI